MKLEGKNILIVSPEPWNHIFVSKHHYAVHLAKRNNKVFFLNPPSINYEIKNSANPNLKVIDYTGFWKGLRYYPKLMRMFNQRIVFNRLQKLANVKFDIIWSFDNSVFFDFDALPKGTLKISHIVDLNQDFETRRAASSADICFGVIPAIVERLKKYNSKSFLVKHGVSIFSTDEQVKLPGKRKFKALYFGNLSMPDLNWSLLREAVKQLNEVDFILLGSNHQAVPKELRESAYLLPPVPTNKLGSYMSSADVLFLFYAKSYNSNYASPHKVMEYISSGKPIISTYLYGYENSDLIFCVSDEKWAKMFRNVLLQKSKYFSQKNSEDRLNYARRHTYEKQIEKIENIIASTYE